MQRLVRALCTLSNNALFALPRLRGLPHVSTRFPKMECCPCDGSATSDNRTNNARLPFFNLCDPQPQSHHQQFSDHPNCDTARHRHDHDDLNALRIAGER